MKFEKYLPLGSVVLLKDATKRMMIIGYEGLTEEDNFKIYDYIGCLYPEGVIAVNKNLLFNHDQIDQIYFFGYSDIEDQEFKNKLKIVANDRDKNAKKIIEHNKSITKDVEFLDSQK